jgi:dTDP-4-dehydrorhamnose 3,5-epimerase-like enzyme
MLQHKSQLILVAAVFASDSGNGVMQIVTLHIAVDICKHSPSYGQWIGATLSEDNGHMLHIHTVFAHGFCVLSEASYETC